MPLAAGVGTLKVPDVQSPNGQLSLKPKAMSQYFEYSFIPVFAQAVIYGLYVETFFQCLRWLLLDDKDWNIRKKINWSMLTIGITLFTLMTINLWTAVQLTVGPALHVNVLAAEQSWLVPVDVRLSSDKMRLD